MRIINRYVFREAFYFTLICLCAFLAVLLTLRMLKFAALIINRGVGFSQIGMLFLSIIPSFLEIALPLAVLLGVMLAMGRLSGDSEVIVLRASGISIASLLRPIFILGAGVFLLNLFVAIYASPASLQQLNRTLFGIARSRSLAGLEAGVFNKLGHLTLYAEEIDYHTGKLKRVLVDDRRDPENRSIVTAQDGTILSDETARTIVIRLERGAIHELIDGKYVITDYKTNSLAIDANEIYDPDSNKQGLGSREMTFAELDAEIASLREKLRAASTAAEPSPLSEEPAAAALAAKGDEPVTPDEIQRRITKLRTEWNRRLAMPFASLFLALAALPLGIQVPRSQRTWGIGLAAALAMGMFVIYYALLSLGVGLAEAGLIAPALGLWLPNIAALAFAVHSNRRIGSEDWHSIPHALETAISGMLYRYRTRAA